MIRLDSYGPEKILFILSYFGNVFAQYSFYNMYHDGFILMNTIIIVLAFPLLLMIKTNKIFFINTIIQVLTSMLTIGIIMNNNISNSMPMYVLMMVCLMISTQIEKIVMSTFCKDIQKYKAKEKIDDISKKLVRHDVNNTLMDYIKYVDKDRISEADVNRLEVLRLLDSTDFNYKHTVGFEDILSSTLSSYDYNMFDLKNVNKNESYNINKYVLVSILRNLYNNAIEAHHRNKLDNDVKISILNEASTITVSDNCGGFDVEDIIDGKSSKSNTENGVFLKLLTNVSVQELLGISFEIISKNGYTSAILNIK